MTIRLPDASGQFEDYRLSGRSVPSATLPTDPARVVFSAAHVVADPFTGNDPSGRATVDWKATMAFRHHLAGLGLGIAEAMDTAQRGMGLDWPGALELIRRTREELPDALVANGCGTDHLDPATVTSIDDVRKAYLEQVEAKIAQLALLRDELTRIVGRCRGGLSGDCRVIEALGDHRHCESAHV